MAGCGAGRSNYRIDLAESEIDVEPEDEISDQEVKNPRWLQVSVGILLILLTAGILVSIIL